MPLDINVDLIRKYSLFCTLSEMEVQEVVDKMVPVSIDEGDTIFQEDEYGDKLYFTCCI
jgi:hypothetical protein